MTRVAARVHTHPHGELRTDMLGREWTALRQDCGVHLGRGAPAGREVPLRGAECLVELIHKQFRIRAVLG